MSIDSDRYKRVKQAEEELNRRIEETFAPKSKAYWWSRAIWLVFTPIVIGIVIGTWLCQVYAVLIGSKIAWTGISSLLKGQPLFQYVAGSAHPLLFFQFNPGLGNFCLGWGILCSVMISWGKAQGNIISLLVVAIFGIANLVTGLINLFRNPCVLAIHTEGFFSFLISIWIGLSIVMAVLQSWKR
jgi:hypothetical protein